MLTTSNPWPLSSTNQRYGCNLWPLDDYWDHKLHHLLRAKLWTWTYSPPERAPNLSLPICWPRWPGSARRQYRGHRGHRGHLPAVPCAGLPSPSSRSGRTGSTTSACGTHSWSATLATSRPTERSWATRPTWSSPRYRHNAAFTTLVMRKISARTGPLKPQDMTYEVKPSHPDKCV